AKGQLLLSSYEDMLRGGKEGPSLVPGDLDRSLMFRRVSLPSTHEDYMPAEGKTGLTDDERAVLEWWIINDAPPTRQLALMNLENDMSAKFERVLGIAVSSDSRLPETEVAAADSSSIKVALAEGFVIKKIIPESNFLEVRLPFTGQNLSNMKGEALLP